MSLLARRFDRSSLRLSAPGYAIGLLTVVLAVLAARAGSAAPGANPWLIALDVTVGLAFVGGAIWAPGSRRERALQAAIGMSWLIASFVPVARLAHQAMLAIALTAFPRGNPRGVAGWLLIGVAVGAALLAMPQGIAALLFAAIAVRALVGGTDEPHAAWYPAAAGAGVAVVLAASTLARGLYPGAFDPGVTLLAYSLVLLGVAIGFPLAMRAAVAGAARLSERLLSDGRLVGLDGIAAVLRDALRDRELRVYRWDQAARAYVDGRGQVLRHESDGDRWLPVADGSEPLGLVAYRAAALEDPPTAVAVAEAMRLALRRLHWQESLRSQLSELEAARARLVAAADRERTATASRLRHEVVWRIRQAVAQLRSIRAVARSGDAMEALDVAVRELDVAGEEVVGLVAGIPPAELGEGGLVAALRGLAERSPVPVTVTSEPGATGDAELETTLFYVCSEALTNAIKHASSRRIEITIRQDEDAIVASVSDDGVGGANPSGSGLQGLSDRLAARGGRLHVKSPPGAGTQVIARIPR